MRKLDLEIWTELPRSRGDDDHPKDEAGPLDDLALGSGVREAVSGQDKAKGEAAQQLLASGRNVCQSTREVCVLIQGGRFRW